MEQILDHIIGAGRLLPVTVVAAIILFGVKEGIEANRRRKANSRKRQAVRRLIADEIERNNWAIKRLRDGIFQIERHLVEANSKISIQVSALGERYVRREEDGEMASQFPIGKVYSEVLSANLLVLGEIDEAIFDEALNVNDAIKELDHVCTSMIEILSKNNDRGFLEGFADHAKKEIADCEKTLQSFYQNVTGRALETHRIR
ncbi:hypothetical protein K3729_04135 [Rhodobacteraceae bacterium S2214]|nr:hypothetical protein K3729_04135 [Rhodobacteraceae bacterium S2214]